MAARINPESAPFTACAACEGKHGGCSHPPRRRCALGLRMHMHACIFGVERESVTSLHVSSSSPSHAHTRLLSQVRTFLDFYLYSFRSSLSALFTVPTRPTDTNEARQSDTTVAALRISNTAAGTTSALIVREVCGKTQGLKSEGVRSRKRPPLLCCNRALAQIGNEAQYINF